ncbi:MAG: hypothetical protein EOR84_34285 [Mesorhizobium sp.]|uniref:hypothetical protein n=1 Tax=Mesorhizobium sp. TaxID=1871066 RepID=UPI000FE7C9BD|nr:hypothetical protein [Mesorhizobium sp.]RWM82836.1 MAG: hypothetical protein EOR84_34285 [Mesorhizobium sp.]
MKSFTLDGKRHRIHPRIPLQQIRWLVSRQHIATSDAEIEELITKRTTDWSRAAIHSAKSSPSCATARTKPSEGIPPLTTELDKVKSKIRALS